jgi:hypothetical protein
MPMLEEIVANLGDDLVPKTGKYCFIRTNSNAPSFPGVFFCWAQTEKQLVITKAIVISFFISVIFDHQKIQSLFIKLKFSLVLNRFEYIDGVNNARTESFGLQGSRFKKAINHSTRATLPLTSAIYRWPSPG